jgi:hypothetical protein
MYKQMLHGLLPVVGFCLILIIFSHFALSVAFCELNNQLVITRPIRLAVILPIMSALNEDYLQERSDFQRQTSQL